MKKYCLAFAIVTFCFVSCKKEIKDEVESGEVNTTDTIKTKETLTEPPLDSAAQMKAWTDYATPGNAHKMMAEEVGTWNCDMSFWMEPDGKSEKATAVANIKMVMGGRYQETNFNGTMMGQPFEGKSTLAYNNASKEYTTTFIDNMGTGMMIGMGKFDEGTRSMEFKGNMVNPINGKKTPYREIYTIVDPKTRRVEMFDVKDGEEYKSMEIVMKKK